jgi:hypothetical protein
MGASAIAETGSRPTGRAATRLVATRFDPARGRTLESLTRLEKRWLKGRFCRFCDAPCLGSLCYAYSGEYVLPVIDGVRDKEETVDLGPACNMDEMRASWLAHYKPRPAKVDRSPEGSETRSGSTVGESAVPEGHSPNPSSLKSPVHTNPVAEEGQHDHA